MSLWGLLLKPLGWAGLLVMFASFVLYALLQTLCGVWFRTQNLKKRYNAQWALVTGSSSGGPGVSVLCCPAELQRPLDQPQSLP
jgi:hypothetical protein